MSNLTEQEDHRESFAAVRGADVYLGIGLTDGNKLMQFLASSQTMSEPFAQFAAHFAAFNPSSSSRRCKTIRGQSPFTRMPKLRIGPAIHHCMPLFAVYPRDVS